jgi:predicted transcriptional regulator
VRITINLPDDLVQRAKRAALESGTTLSKIIENALRESLAKPRRRLSRREFKIIACGKGGLMPGVNLDDTSALLDIMDGIDKD